MNARWVVCSISLAFLSFPSQASAQHSEKPPTPRFTVSRATSAIQIDGRLNESAWNEATVIDLPYEWFPGENIEPPVETQCLLTYDDTNLYVAFRAFDPEPEKIRAHLMDRDQVDTLVQDDFVGFMVDTFNDQRRAFQFRINPMGVQAEALNSLTSEDWEWDIIWDSAGQIHDEGFTVEVAVPFNQLRFPRGREGLTFGFDALRSWPRNVRHRMVSRYWDFNDSCTICQYAKVSGFQGLNPGHNLEFDPTLTSSRTDRREDFPDGDLESGDVDVEPGLTGRWGITPNLTYTGAVNPDFSQVEADVAQLEVNERFALFFPERRPFFLEGMDFFQSPNEIVFTRTVANPLWGNKLTGKIGANALGVFVTRDRVNNLVIPTNQFSSLDSVDQEVTGTVMRYRRDIGRSSNLGVLYTGREADGYHNRAVGFDGLIQLASADTLEFQYVRTDTLYPDDIAQRHDQSNEPFQGRGFTIDYNHDTRHWSWAATYEDVSPGFRADSGFIPRVDFRKVESWIAHTWWGSTDTWWTSFYLGPGFERTEDHSGMLTNQSIGLEGGVQGPMQSDLFVNVAADKEYFNGELFDLTRASFNFEIQPSGTMKLGLGGDLGDEIDSFNTQKGNLLNLSPTVEIKLGKHINLKLDHSYQRLDVENGRLFTENLSEARFFYYFNVRTLVRLIVQYRAIDSDPDLFPIPIEPHNKNLFLQFLASYKLNPRTVIFIGYTDNYIGTEDVGLTQTDRTFFIKLGYAWTL